MARSVPPAAPTRELGGYPVRETTLTDIPAAPPPPPPPPPPGRARWPWLAALAVLVLLGGLGAAYAVAHPDSQRSARTTPRVSQPSPAAPAPVTSTPKPTVARTPKPKPNLRVVVPRIVGETVEQAKATLRALGLAATTSTVRSRQPRNTVVGQNPRSGDKPRPGRAARL